MFYYIVIGWSQDTFLHLLFTIILLLLLWNQLTFVSFHLKILLIVGFHLMAFLTMLLLALIILLIVLFFTHDYSILYLLSQCHQSEVQLVRHLMRAHV